MTELYSKVRMNISVPKTLRDRMKRDDRGISWSGVASRAFDAVLRGSTTDEDSARVTKTLDAFVDIAQDVVDEAGRAAMPASRAHKKRKGD